MEKTEQQKPVNYQDYTFKPDVSLEVSPFFLDNIRRFANNIINQGSDVKTAARFEYVHKETSEVAKEGTKKEKLDAEYKKVFSLEKTLRAIPIQTFTEEAKQAMQIIAMLEDTHRLNVDDGKGILIEDFKKEIEEQQKAVQQPQVVTEEE